MNELAVMLAAFGLGTAIHVALETEAGAIMQRAALASLCLVLVALGVISV